LSLLLGRARITLVIRLNLNLSTIDEPDAKRKEEAKNSLRTTDIEKIQTFTFKKSKIFIQ